MFKENGRVSKPIDTETSNVVGKEFVCKSCGKITRVTNVEFGEELLCECGEPMVETYED